MARKARNPVGPRAAATGKAQKGQQLLGWLTTFSHPDDFVNGPKAVRSWASNGLDVNDLPQQRHGFHIFQSACRSVESRRRNGQEVEVHVDEVLHDDRECVYQVTRMVRDKANRLIEHPKAMTLAYEKATETITVKELADFDALRGIEEQIREDYKRNAKKIPGQKLRDCVRGQLLKMGAQNLRRKAGGLYFVPETYSLTVNGRSKRAETKPLLDGLAAVLDDLYGERGDFYAIPLISEESAQDMVRKHFTINVNERAREAMERAVQRARAGKGRGVRPDFLANLWNERRQIAASIKEFDGLVALERTDIDQNLRDLDEALNKLQEVADS